MNIHPHGRRSPVRQAACIAAVTAAGLGAAAIVNAVLARQAERRHPPAGSFIEVDGVRLHYIEKGSGPPVVLLHGNQSMAEEFVISGVFDLLARRHRVIAFDRPGFGYSERPRGTSWTPSAQAALIHRALAQLGVARPVVLGHSWGGLLALTYAVEHPADTGAVLLLSGYYFASPRLDVLLAVLAALPVLGDVLRHTVWPLLGWLSGPALLKMVFAPSPVAQRFKDEFPMSLALRPSHLRATADDGAQMNSGAARLAGRIGQLAMPIAIIAGRGDRVVRIGPQPVRLHALLPESTLKIVEDTGHMVHHAVPEQIAAAVDALCTEVQAGTGRTA